jgi:hypothetical protein
MGRLDGVRPGEGVEPGRGTEVERVKGGKYILEVRWDIILVPTSDVVIRLALQSTPSSVHLPPCLLSSIHTTLPPVPSIITDAPSPSCPEVNPHNTVHPLTSSPPNHSPSIKTNSHPPLTRPRLLIPIPKILSTALKLSRRDRIWIWSPIPLSSPLLPRRFRFPSALPLAPPSAGIR